VRPALAGLLVAAVAACKGDGSSDPAGGAGGGAAASASQSKAAAPAGKMRLRDAPPEGDVDGIVRAELKTTRRENRRLLVYVGATWCEPCQRFHHAAERGELDATFPDVDMVTFDLDRDNERLASAGYVSKLIPLFALPGPDGRASGKQIEGGIKGEGAVGYIAPRLQKMLAE